MDEGKQPAQVPAAAEAVPVVDDHVFDPPAGVDDAIVRKYKAFNEAMVQKEQDKLTFDTWSFTCQHVAAQEPHRVCEPMPYLLHPHPSLVLTTAGEEEGWTRLGGTNVRSTGLRGEPSASPELPEVGGGVQTERVHRARHRHCCPR